MSVIYLLIGVVIGIPVGCWMSQTSAPTAKDSDETERFWIADHLTGVTASYSGTMPFPEDDLLWRTKKHLRAVIDQGDREEGKKP